jgi:ferritin-like metal-binding protein YciE
LKAAIQSHLKQSEGHVLKLEQVFQSFELKAKGKTCEATVGLLAEGAELAEEFKGSPAINAALISAAQKVEHYEIASYGCLHAWSELLGNKKAGGLLKQILDEEKGANEALNELAESSLNQVALGETPQNGSQEKPAAKKTGNSPRSIQPAGPRRKLAEVLTA